jgi:hypothetical protein
MEALANHQLTHSAAKGKITMGFVTAITHEEIRLVYPGFRDQAKPKLSGVVGGDAPQTTGAQVAALKAKLLAMKEAKAAGKAEGVVTDGGKRHLIGALQTVVSNDNRIAKRQRIQGESQGESSRSGLGERADHDFEQ